MKIRLRKIKLTNFKGIRYMEIAFNQTTNIYGENAAGKTTICDAFLWCLFGKDSADRKDFEIKTLDANNKVIPQIDHEVECELQLDDHVVILKRALREKWVKRRGDNNSEFAGNETVFFWNDVPLKLNEYQQKISEIVDEGLFKLVTNPLYFNTNLKWQDRRVVLFSLAEQVYDADVLKSIERPHNVDQVFNLTKLLNQGKTITEIKKELAAKKKKLKDELDFIPTRINEANHSKPEHKDWEAIENKISTLKNEIAVFNKQKEDIVSTSQIQNQKIIDKQNELNGLKLKLQQMEHELTASKRQQKLELESGIKTIRAEIERLELENLRSKESINSLTSRIGSLEVLIGDLRKEWSDINSRKFELSDDKTMCPACLQKLPDSEIAGITEKLTTNFNTQKARDLQANNDKGLATKSEIETCRTQIASLTEKINQNAEIIASKSIEVDQLFYKLENLNSEQVLPTPEILSLKSEIDAFEIPKQNPQDFTEINDSIYSLQKSLDEFNVELSKKGQIDIIEARVNELQQSESRMSQELADLENTEFVVDAFNKCKIDTMVESVNKKFKYVTFKLFKENINGGIEECCEALVNTNGAWVPYSGGNTAGQINAGIDVINTICQHNNFWAPIFIDNRESVNELIPTESQIINLIVSLDKTLKIQ